MAIRKPTRAATSSRPDGRRLERASGRESLVDIAKRAFADERAAPLLCDLNPELPARGAVPAGARVVVPSRAEARRFAARLGFSLGYRPEAGGSTAPKRAWREHCSGGRRLELDPRDLARSLVSRGLSPEEVAGRVTALCGDAALAEGAALGEAPELGAVRAELQRAASERAVRAHLAALRDLFDSTRRPAARERLVSAAARDTDAVAALFGALLVPAARAASWAAGYAAAAPRLEAVRDQATLDPSTRAALSARDDRFPAALVEASARGLELLDDEGCAALGLLESASALEAHLGKLSTTCERLLEASEGASASVLGAVRAGDAKDLPQPWPVAATLIARLGERVDAVHAGRRAHGLAALFCEPVEPKAGAARAPQLSAGELLARAAADARAADESLALATRLAPTVKELAELVLGGELAGGSVAQAALRRRARFERAVFAERGRAGDAATLEQLAEDLLARARGAADEGVRRRARALPRGAQAGCARLAAELSEPMQVLLRGASDLLRALVAVSLALDPEVGPSLASAGGRQAAKALAQRHVPQVVSLAAQGYAAG
jgi:hypothetical protein